MDEIDRLKLAMRAEQALRELRSASELERRDEAEEIGVFAIRMLGLPPSVSGSKAPALLHRLWQVVRGGRPDEKKEDAIQIRAIAAAVDGAANLLGHHGPELAAYALRHWLARIDPAFAPLSDATLLEKARAVHEGRMATSGVVTDLLIESGALGVRPNESRGTLQGRVYRASQSR